MDNSDHYKYMPRSAREEMPEPEVQDEHQNPDSDKESADIQSEVPATSYGESSIKKYIDKTKPEVTEKKEEDILVENGEYPLMQLLNFFFSPFLVPTIATWFLFQLSVLHILLPCSTTPYTLTVFGATCVVPGMAIFILLKAGAIRSLQMYSSRERIVPFMLQIIALGAMGLFFLYKGANPWIWTVFCGGAAIGLVNLVLNFFLRVSNHCSAMAALLAVLIVINENGLPQESMLWWLIGVVLCGGISGVIAILAGRHSVWEVMVGYATGFLGIILFSMIH